MIGTNVPNDIYMLMHISELILSLINHGQTQTQKYCVIAKSVKYVNLENLLISHMEVNNGQF